MNYLFRTALLLAALLAGGCSSFNYEWRQAAKQPAAHDISGRWEGRWVSQASGHAEGLRALVQAVDTNHYDVKFYAAYKKVITVHFGYTVRMETRNGTDNTMIFHGSEDLGKLAGGVYTYDGHTDATNFFSTYKSKYDHGTFEMKRPAP